MPILTLNRLAWNKGEPLLTPRGWRFALKLSTQNSLRSRHRLIRLTLWIRVGMRANSKAQTNTADTTIQIPLTTSFKVLKSNLRSPPREIKRSKMLTTDFGSSTESTTRCQFLATTSSRVIWRRKWKKLGFGRKSFTIKDSSRSTSLMG